MSELKGQKIDLSQDLSDLEYLKLTKLQGIVYDVIHFFKAVPAGIGRGRG